jgi:hypothetical protein
MRGIVGYQNFVRHHFVRYQSAVGCQRHRQPSGVASAPLLGSQLRSDA